MGQFLVFRFDATPPTHENILKEDKYLNVERRFGAFFFFIKVSPF